MSQFKAEYTPSEWTEREAYYIEKLSKINISRNPTMAEVNENNSLLDALFTEAAFDHALIKRKEYNINLDLKNAEVELFNTCKMDALTQNKDIRLTEKDISALVKKYLLTNNIHEYKLPIYTMIKAVNSRLIFIDRVVDIITQKRAALITANGMLKIEKSLSGAKDVNCYS